MVEARLRAGAWIWTVLLLFPASTLEPRPLPQAQPEQNPPAAQIVPRASELKEGRRVYTALRSRLPLNRGWRFKRQLSPGAAAEPEFDGAEKPAFDDAAWTEVALPHTWDATPDHPFAPPGHFRGLGWYRRWFDAPAEWQGHRVHLEFKGVFQVADVWVNGLSAGHHVGGFTGFTFDVTDSVHWGARNLVAVRVNDVLNPDIAPTNESNVTVYGGIYRSVALVITDVMHFPANPVVIQVQRGENGGALVYVNTRIENAGAAQQDRRLETLIVDALGQPVFSLPRDVSLGPKLSFEVAQTSPLVANPHYWSPDDPYLYSVISTLFQGDQALDRVATPFGIRFMGYDPAAGFTLNGKPINLHGVNRRQDYGFLGDALPEAIAIKDVRAIKAMGANFLRTSHYPQDPAVLDACDHLGILAWEEIPNIKIYMYPPSSEDIESHYAERFPRALMANLKQQLLEMIERDRNHPSIIIWGLADDLSTYHYPEDFVELVNAAHALDPTRWTAGRAPHVTDVIDATSEPDLVTEHTAHPERKYIWNEWGAFPAERGREGPPFYERAPVSPEADASMGDSDAALLMEGYLMQWNALPWLGTAKWCMFDPSSVNSVRTIPLYARHKDQVMLRWPFDDYRGVADFWRLPKNGFYLLQSQWTDKPMAHIVGHWTWPHEEGQKRTVRVYSNCDTVELFLNGKSLGVRQPETADLEWQDFHRNIDQYKYPDAFNQQRLPNAQLPHPPFVWADVPYEPGRLTAVGHKGAATVNDDLRTAAAPVRLSLKADQDTLAADPPAFEAGMIEGADTSDVAFIEADVVDANGTIVPDARPWVRFSVEGPGRLLGATEIDAISGVAAINVQTTGQPGEIVVTATGPGLEPGSVRIQAVK